MHDAMTSLTGTAQHCLKASKQSVLGALSMMLVVWATSNICPCFNLCSCSHVQCNLASVQSDLKFTSLRGCQDYGWTVHTEAGMNKLVLVHEQHRQLQTGIIVAVSAYHDMGSVFLQCWMPVALLFPDSENTKAIKGPMPLQWHQGCSGFIHPSANMHH